jgi:alkylation response protein AidB-like acyl-CoA dehydrogenase
MSARRDGEDFVLSGQKTWTSFATVSDWMFCLARTDPNAAIPQRGISMFLVNMDTPGMTVRPIELINGDDEFCETFFDEVRVPVENLLGRENEGWTVAKALLLEERRATPAWNTAAWPFPIADVWREHGTGDPEAEARVVQNELDRLALDATLARARRLASQGDAGAESIVNVLKVWFAEHQQRRADLVTLLRGWEGNAWSGDVDEESLAATRSWLTARALSIAGGTTEIQLNIISKRDLGLPT